MRGDRIVITRDEDTDFSVFEKKSQRAAADSFNAVGASGTLPLGKLGLLIVASPTPEDEILIRMEFRRQCLPLLRSPLQQIADDVKGLPAELASIAVRAAVELQSGHSGRGEPSEEMIFSRLYTPDGAAFRVWALARHAHQDLTLTAVRAEITEETVIETLANLWRAFQPKDAAEDDVEKKVTGEPTSPESGRRHGPAFTES